MNLFVAEGTGMGDKEEVQERQEAATEALAEERVAVRKMGWTEGQMRGGSKNEGVRGEKYRADPSP